MTREEIEKAAREFIHQRGYTGWMDFTDFAIQQVNAALEEAAKLADQYSDESWQGDRISALKVKP